MLICPLCQSPLQPTQSGVACDNRHSFDRARQGYLNLLPVQHKASRAPGDNAAMVQARREFLSAGHYQPVADFLCQHAAASQAASWLDIGCGEGYYTAQLAAAMGQAAGYALDISKDAVVQACKRNKDIQDAGAQPPTWLVASMARVPLVAHSMGLLTSVFSPLDWGEVQRLLAVHGQLLHLGPAADHLIELRQMIYDDVRPYDDAKHLEHLPAGLAVTKTEFLSVQIRLEQEADRRNLLAMTPHGQRTRQQRYDTVLQQLEAVTVSVRLDCIQRTAGGPDAT